MTTSKLVLGAFLTLGCAAQPPREAEVAAAGRGRVAGVVLDAVSGEPLAGAFVAIDSSGDAGGSNLERFRDEGIYVTDETGGDGRFSLEGVAFRPDHPFYVTRAGYVRHRETVAVRSGEERPDRVVRLQPGATLHAMAVDRGEPAASGAWYVRLEAADGREFFPIRADWPVTPYRLERADPDGAVSFGELEAGSFSLVAWRLSARAASYHGSASEIHVGAGETREMRLEPAAHSSRVSVRIPGPLQHARLLVSRNPATLLWVDDRAHHPEDSRLGHLIASALLDVPLHSGGSFVLEGWPPGAYAVVALVLERGVELTGVRIEVEEGVEKTIELARGEATKLASVRLDRLGGRIRVEAGEYSVRDVCTRLTARTEGRPAFTADPSIAPETVRLEAFDDTLWNLLETVHAKTGWRLDEAGEDAMALLPAR